MIGSFLTRGLVMAFGYAYPAYECYKTVEMNKPEIEQLRFWCQYWILVAVLSVCERIGDAFISWVPMYSEAKLAFFIYLWYPKTKGTTYVYDSFFRPYVAKHENEIDRNLLELRTRAGDMAILYWQRAASYGQTRVFEILQYVASQSTPRPRPAQSQQGARARQPTASNRQPATATQPATEEPPSPTSSTSSSQHQEEVAEEVGPSQVPQAAPPARANSLKANTATSNTQKANSASSNAQKANSAASNAQKANSASSNAQKANSAASNAQKANSAASNAQKANSAALNAQKANSAALNAQKANSAASNAQKANSASESTSQSMPTEQEAMQVDPVSSAADENANPPRKETVMEETIRRVTRNGLRNRSASNH